MAYKLGAPGCGFKRAHGSGDSGHFPSLRHPSTPTTLFFTHFIFCACVCVCTCGGQWVTSGNWVSPPSCGSSRWQLLHLLHHSVPRQTQGLPARASSLTLVECLQCFVGAIFYVGKGTRARPDAHLWEALGYRERPGEKVRTRGRSGQACQPSDNRRAEGLGPDS